MAKDPVCGMEVDLKKALKAVKKGKTAYFCSAVCKKVFLEGGEHAEQQSTTTTFLISGMHCATCAGTIERTLYRIKGIQKADANFATETATITYDPRVSKKTIIDAAKKLGYIFTEKQAEKTTPDTTPATTETDTLILRIIGMDNQHCVSTVDSAISPLPGIVSKELTINERAVIKYDPAKVSQDAIKEAIDRAGYKPTEATGIDTEKKVREQETKKHKKTFITATALTIPVVILSFAELLGITFPLYKLIMLLFASIVQFYCGRHFYRGTYYATRNYTATMDTLIALGTTAAYTYSLLALFSTTTFGNDLYFDTSTVIITFILLGKWLEAVVKGKASEALKQLISLQPQTATILRDGIEKQIPIDEVKTGDILIIKPGQRIPVDGIVVQGISAVDESAITGESVPVAKKQGDAVIGATINKQGLLKIKATQVGKNTTLANIIKLVEEAQLSKAPIQRYVDLVSSYFVPTVFCISIITFVTWWSFAGETISFALGTFIAVLIIACPCALGLATPTAIIVGTGKAAQAGILIKNSEALERAHKISTIIFDKTGTLTKGKPEVTNILPLQEGLTEDQVLLYAATAEKGSEHPLAEAILTAAKTKNMTIPEASDYQAVPGQGILAKYQRKRIALGTATLLNDNKYRTPENAPVETEKLENEGKTVVYVGYDRNVIGLIAVQDTEKEHAKDAIEELQHMNINVYLLTGDNERTAQAIATRVGIDNVLARVMPDKKAEEIRKFQKKGQVVAMVGDGINDAPALAQADIGIAIGAGTDVALETGQIILVKNDIRDVVTAIQLSSYTFRKIKQNLFWAFVYNTVGIPIAAGVLYPFTGFLLSPVIAAAAMALSSVSVVSNSLVMKWYTPKFLRK